MSDIRRGIMRVTGFLFCEASVRQWLPPEHRIIGRRETDGVNYRELLIEGPDMPVQVGDAVAKVEMGMSLKAPGVLALNWMHVPEKTWEVRLRH